MTIPKIIHQIWVGPKPAPTNLMKTWKDKHPEFEYIFWTESEFIARGMTFRCQDKIDMIQEYCGKADIIRLEILYKYGGVYIDADSICIEPLDDYFMNKTAFATFENENMRENLVANGNMGFIPNHPLCRDMIEWIKSDESNALIQNFRAWYSVGPALLTKFLNTGNYRDFSVFPSHCFLPVHFTGPKYEGHKKVYAYQEWGTAKQNYDTMNSLILPDEFKLPVEWVSVLVSSYNTNKMFLRECLDSIQIQVGYFGIELVWINDGSYLEYTTILEAELAYFEKRTRFTKVVYKKMEQNQGLSYCLNEGVHLCTHELIFRMDSDDIMTANRISKQLEFMKNTADCMICGSSIQDFKNDSIMDPKSKMLQMEKRHAFVFTWQDFLNTRPTWFLNHPTLCFRKSAVLEVGNYDKKLTRNVMEDYDLELRFLRRYGKVYSLPDSLVYYRIHTGQITYNLDLYTPENIKLRDQIQGTYGSKMTDIDGN